MPAYSMGMVAHLTVALWHQHLHLAAYSGSCHCVQAFNNFSGSMLRLPITGSSASQPGHSAALLGEPANDALETGRQTAVPQFGPNIFDY
jgi:hypothetical protein